MPPMQLSLPVVAPALAPGRPGGALLEERNAVEYVEMTVRSILTWVEGRHMTDTFSLNPYRGCEFGCSYCYARYTHEFLDLADWEAFERRIFVKREAARALRRDLASSRDVARHGIAIGTATDPYQPAEARFRITRQVLEALLPHRGLSLSLVTKSGLISRDVDLWARLAERHRVTVFFSCITTDRHLLRAIERRSPTAEVRFSAMRKLVDAGVNCELLMMPVMPGLTDDEASMEAVARAARQAGASALYARALWLSTASRRRFDPWLRDTFPDLYERYASTYGDRGMYAPDEYRREIAERVARVKKRVGFPSA